MTMPVIVMFAADTLKQLNPPLFAVPPDPIIVPPETVTPAVDAVNSAPDVDVQLSVELPKLNERGSVRCVTLYVPVGNVPPVDMMFCT